MQKLGFVLAAALAVVLMAGGSTFAAYPFPELTDEEQTFEKPQLSGTPRPLRISVSDVPWNGSGSVDIPVTLSQRARVWIGVYEIGSDVTGLTGPNNTVNRFQPQDLFLNVVPNETGVELEAGNNVITWDGRDWQGNAVSSGNYEFDVIGINNLDPAVLMGVVARTGFIDPVIDMRKDPPENWTTEVDEPLFRSGGWQCGARSVWHGPHCQSQCLGTLELLPEHPLGRREKNQWRYPSRIPTMRKSSGRS